jgi:hypothetical protein
VKIDFGVMRQPSCFGPRESSRYEATHAPGD